MSDQNASTLSPVELLSGMSSEAITASVQEFESLSVETPDLDDGDFAAIAKKNSVLYPQKLAPLETFSDIAQLVKDLYPAEKTLCNRSASECGSVLAAGALAHATSAANVYWQQVKTDNERDAFRHSYWNAAMTIRIGFAKAKEWADAHEYGNPNRKANSVGEQMDFYNNSVGRNIGNEAMGVLAAYRDSEIVTRVKSGIKSGRMKIVSKPYASEPQATGGALVSSNTYSSVWPFYW